MRIRRHGGFGVRCMRRWMDTRHSERTAILVLVAEVETRSENETMEFAAAFGRLLAAGDVVVLRGELGAGKTAFARGVAAGVGCDPAEVQSPTFTIAREYRGGRIPLFHLDIYRLVDPVADLEEIGYEAYFDPRDGASLIEWGDRAAELLPPKRLEVTIAATGGPHAGAPPEAAAAGRRISVRALGMSLERARDMRARLAAFGPGMPGTRAAGRERAERG